MKDMKTSGVKRGNLIVDFQLAIAYKIKSLGFSLISTSDKQA